MSHTFKMISGAVLGLVLMCFLFKGCTDSMIDQQIEFEKHEIIRLDCVKSCDGKGQYFRALNKCYCVNK